MDFLTWGRSPWGEAILTHISWDLLWASLFAGVGVSRRARQLHGVLARIASERQRKPTRWRRRGRICRSASPGIRSPARLFHWVMAAAMFVLLFTAFLPVSGVQFPWVTWHWMAGSC